jgi:hypothetical protein
MEARLFRAGVIRSLLRQFQNLGKESIALYSTRRATHVYDRNQTDVVLITVLPRFTDGLLACLFRCISLDIRFVPDVCLFREQAGFVIFTRISLSETRNPDNVTGIRKSPVSRLTYLALSD